MVDSPSFPYVSAKYPEVSENGAWTPAAVYSQQDIASFVAFAQAHFVKTVIEIDTPAHTLALAKSHPEMMTDCWEWMATSHYKVSMLRT